MNMPASSVSVLFVCMGNICRSPTAEGVFARKVQEAGLSAQIAIDSAGTHAYHIGNAPDERTQRAAMRRGYDLSCLRARKVEALDFTRFDYVLAMDADNLAILQQLRQQAPAQPPRAQLGLMMDFATTTEYARVLDMIEVACDGLLAKIARDLR